MHVRSFFLCPKVPNRRDFSLVFRALPSGNLPIVSIDHFLNELFMNIVYGYESRSRHGDYLPRPIRMPISGWLSEVTPWKSDKNYYKSSIQLYRLAMCRNWGIYTAKRSGVHNLGTCLCTHSLQALHTTHKCTFVRKLVNCECTRKFPSCALQILLC